jgi:acyl-CoA dehydrogenase
LSPDDGIWARLADLEIAIESMEITEHRVMTALASGSNPGPMSSMLKTQGTETMQRVEELAVELAGGYGAVDQLGLHAPGLNLPPVGPDEHHEAMARYLNGRAASIYGGSNEVQRGVMARLMLGL